MRLSLPPAVSTASGSACSALTRTVASVLELARIYTALVPHNDKGMVTEDQMGGLPSLKQGV